MSLSFVPPMRRMEWKSPCCRPSAIFYAMKVHGKNILYFPFDDLSEFVKKPKMSGIPFLAPGPTFGRASLLGQR